jgi:hypothetical protein
MPTSGSGTTAVNYQEIYDSNRESIQLDPSTLKMTAKRTLQCAWDSRYQLINNEYFQPHPSLAWVYAVNFDVEPVGTASAENTYVNANVVITYVSLDYIPTVGGGQGVTVECDVSSKVYTIPSSAFVFSSGSSNAANSMQTSTQIHMSYANYTMTRKNLAALNEGTWAGLINNVNSVAMTISGDPEAYSWGIGSLLYLGYSYRQKYCLGSWLYTVSHKFIGSFSASHNQEFNPSSGQFETVKSRVGGNEKYKSGDLTVL